MYFDHYVYCIFIRICFIALCQKIALMFMFIQPTLSFLYAFLVSRVGKYD